MSGAILNLIIQLIAGALGGNGAAEEQSACDNSPAEADRHSPPALQPDLLLTAAVVNHILICGFP